MQWVALHDHPCALHLAEEPICMTEPLPTLSEHLLREAAKFTFYPQRVRRTRLNKAVQDGFDKLRRQLVEWRKTFAPRGEAAFTDASSFMTSPIMLDELYSRDLLREVPK